ncbi:substrate-binding domain-containing protein [Cohnella terricola]|uniref:Substrate-binding domain-containing protein n=2 Tax=Cohnella terricola TaxID=1289167 RepID=A0A559J909_9BACL|nr:substrate-binding domain-containing protein [Cohnella terricola]
MIVVGCSTNSNTASTSEAPSNSPSKTSSEGNSSKTYNIDVIVKATDSDFWQTVLKGAEGAAADSGGKIKVKTYGPPSEKDIDQQISILENVISKKPDGIVIASTSSDASIPAIEKAMGQNIPVVLVDNRVNTDQFTSFLATDNKKGGALAADMFVEALKGQGKELKGTIGIISSMAGVQVLINRNEGFIERLKEIAPDIKPLETRYTDADIMKALGAAEDILTKDPNVLGFFADNNSTGVGVARAITERNLSGKVPVVAYDADNEEINALKSGAIYALVVQDPYGMGYKGVLSVIDSLEGKEVAKEVDTGATAVTQANFDTDEIQKLLFPEKR